MLIPIDLDVSKTIIGYGNKCLNCFHCKQIQNGWAFCDISKCPNEPDINCPICYDCEFYKICKDEYEYFIDCQREENK